MESSRKSLEPGLTVELETPVNIGVFTLRAGVLGCCTCSLVKFLD
jgi:hypothetical protein